MADNKWERLEPTFSLEDERLAGLKQIVPEAFTDGKVDFERLKELLGEVVEDESAEHFGLNWTGKREARRLAGMPSKGTLVPVPGKGLHEDTTENIFIEGDNLEVLKLLHKSYRGKIKMIYIDPPYNTGNDFIYKDDYRMPLESYLQRSGQKSDMGELLTSNPKSSGRFHSDWLNMMYPRLRVAKDLLREDGVIFVSIDDNEFHNLRQMMNELFGEENFIDCIIWKKRYGGGAKEKYLVTLHEYILFYAKDKDQVNELFIPLSEESIERYYTLKDEKYDTRGPYRTHPLEANKTMDARPNLRFAIPAPDGTEILPKRQWLWSKERTLAALANNELEISKGKDGWNVATKQYLRDETGVMRRGKAFSVIDSVYSQHGTNEIIDLFGNAKVFPYPKPLNLIKAIIDIASVEDNQIILDFYAGSGSTPHAVLEMNRDGTNRKFIAVQIGEATNSGSDARALGFERISDITAARISKASSRINEEQNSKLKLEQPTDLGYAFFRLEHSNFKAWSDYHGNDLDELRGLLQAQIDSTFVDGATEDAILTEILLLEGFPLTSKIEIDESFQKNTVRRSSHEWSEHRLFVTLDKEIQEETIRKVDELIDSEEMSKIDIFICLDNALTDQDKLRLADVCRLKTI